MQPDNDAIKIQNKYCPRCKTEKSKEEFARNKSKVDGLQSRCRECHKIAMFESQERIGKIESNKRKRVLSNRSYHRMKKDDPVRLWSATTIRGARKRARKYGVNIDITAEYLQTLACPFCPVLGIPLDFESEIKNDNSPTVDRLFSDLGYVEGNVNIISDKANRIKNSGSARDLFKLLDWLEKSGKVNHI